MSGGRQLLLLLGLRARTMFRGRGGSGRLVAAVIGMAILVPISLLLGGFVYQTMVGLASRGRPEYVAEWIHLVMALVWLMLVTMPVLGFGANEFFDISRLFHFPVSHRTVFVAQNIGLLFGGSVLFFLPALLGLVMGIPGGIVPLRVLVVFLFLFNAVSVGQMLQLALLNLLRTRRFRDLVPILGALLSAGIYLLFRLFSASGDPQRVVLDVVGKGASRWLAPLPPYWVSSFLAPDAGGAQAALFFAGFLPLTALVVAIAAVLQERAFHGEIPALGLPEKTRRRREARRLPLPLRLIPPEVRAVARKEFRVLRREPLVKSMLIQQSVFILVPAGFAAATILSETDSGRGPELAIRTGIYGFLLVASGLSLNLLGLEGHGIVTLLSYPVPRVRILLGKVLAHFVLWATAMLVVVGAGVVALALLGLPTAPGRLALLAVEGGCGLAVLLGVGAWMSPLLPHPIVSRGSRQALAQGQAVREGCSVALLRVIVLTLVILLLFPVGLVSWFVPGFVFLGIPYAALLLFVGVRIGARTLANREEQVALVLARSQD
jgi:hypothetical protein